MKRFCSLLLVLALAQSPGTIAAEAAQPAAAENAAVAEKSAAPSPSAVRPAADRLDLDASVVTGNRELPKVLYIVPWKKAEMGDLPEQPFNSLLDEVLKPVDRDEFRREVSYYSKIVEQSAPQVLDQFPKE